MNVLQFLAQLNGDRDRTSGARVMKLILALVSFSVVALMVGASWEGIVWIIVAIVGAYMLLLAFTLWIDPDANAPPD